jgi:hypothetical protein
VLLFPAKPLPLGSAVSAAPHSPQSVKKARALQPKRALKRPQKADCRKDGASSQTDSSAGVKESRLMHSAVFDKSGTDRLAVYREGRAV